MRCSLCSDSRVLLWRDKIIWFLWRIFCQIPQCSLFFYLYWSWVHWEKIELTDFKTCLENKDWFITYLFTLWSSLYRQANNPTTSFAQPLHASHYISTPFWMPLGYTVWYQTLRHEPVWGTISPGIDWTVGVSISVILVYRNIELPHLLSLVAVRITKMGCHGTIF